MYRATLHIVLPIIVGAAIYVLWRDQGLLVFGWLDAVQLSGLVAVLRELAAPAGAVLPSWFLLSLPDALWVYAVTATAALIWADASPSPSRALWLSSGLLLGAGSELGQAAALVPGTFDLVDLGACVLAAALAVYLTTSSIPTPTTPHGRPHHEALAPTPDLHPGAARPGRPRGRQHERRRRRE